MTVIRQYKLPNCTLSLEGLSDTTGTTNGSPARAPLTVLVNAECRFAHLGEPLSGGLEFFNSLVSAVNTYIRQWMSGIQQPFPSPDRPETVQLMAIENGLHRLLVRSATASDPVRVDLTTVQLFDLVEAIDQCCADPTTLPLLTLSLSPLARRHARTDVSPIRRAAPAAIGLSGLAAAAALFLMLPTPEIRRPPELDPAVSEEVETPVDPKNSSSSPPDPEGEAEEITPSEPPSSEELAAALENSQEITDPDRLATLGQKLSEDLYADRDETAEIPVSLSYRVTVGADGAIIGYRPEGEAARTHAEATPLPGLRFVPAQGGRASAEAFANFKVAFEPNGVIEVAPWDGYSALPAPPPEIEDPETIERLEGELREILIENWTREPIFDGDLEYRFGVAEDGTIAEVEPLNDAASTYYGELPLAQLYQSEAALTEEDGIVVRVPLAQYRVVFTPQGYLETSPWRGR